MIPNFIKKGIQGSSPRNTASDSPSSKQYPAHADLQHTQSLSSVVNDPKKKSVPSMSDLMTKSGQFLNTIQGTLDKQLGHIAEAVHIATHDNAEFFSPLQPITAKDFDPYLNSVKEHWTEYKDICSSLIRAKESSTTPSTQIENQEGTNAFREIPQVFFNIDYKQSGFEQHQVFTQPIRISVQNQGKMSAVLAGYTKLIEQHLVKHLSNVDGLLKSLMTIAEIQSDIAIAHDRSVYAKETLSMVQEGEVKAGLRLVQLARRRARILHVLRVLDYCDQVSQAKPSVDSLVRTGDFSAATDLVQATRSIIAQHLKGLSMLSGVETFIEEHGRNIDGMIETEFSELVAEYVFGSIVEGEDPGREKKLTSMTVSMSGRDLLVPSLQMKLKETLTKRLKKEMKNLYLSTPLGIVDLFAYLHARLERLVNFVHVVEKAKPNDTMQRLSCLRLFEAVTAAGLARMSQQLVQRMDDSTPPPAGAEWSAKINELKTLRKVVSSQLEKSEQIYIDAFRSLDLEEHISFASSVIGSASQNGFSPDLDATVAGVARQRLSKFHDEIFAQTNAQIQEEKWDKAVPPSAELARMIAAIDPSPSVLADFSGSDSSPSSSVTGPPKFLKLNKVNFLLVPAGLALAETLVQDYLGLALAVPGVAVDCLSKIAALVRQANSASRELVLEGGLTVNQKKVINATNLALASQLVGFFSQLLAAIGRKFCMHYRIENELVQAELSPVSSGAVLVDDASAALDELLVQVVMELNEHRMEIFIKLGDILVSRFDYHLQLWLTVGSSSEGPLEGIVKDFTAMYKVLLKSLQTDNLKRVFSRAFSESASHFADQLGEIKTMPTSAKAELACKLRIDLLFLFQNLLVGEAMSGVKPALSAMVADMVSLVETELPLVDKSAAAEDAVVKLKSLLRADN